MLGARVKVTRRQESPRQHTKRRHGNPKALRCCCCTSTSFGEVEKGQQLGQVLERINPEGYPDRTGIEKVETNEAKERRERERRIKRKKKGTTSIVSVFKGHALIRVLPHFLHWHTTPFKGAYRKQSLQFADESNFNLERSACQFLWKGRGAYLNEEFLKSYLAEFFKPVFRSSAHDDIFSVPDHGMKPTGNNALSKDETDVNIRKHGCFHPVPRGWSFKRI